MTLRRIVIDYCIEFDYCTHMDNHQYERMLEICLDDNRYASDIINEIAPMIWICSDIKIPVDQVRDELNKLFYGR